MRRILLVVLVLLLLPSSVWAACTGSSPNWASTADLSSVQECVTGATAGDTITVTGNATWTNYLLLTRGVNIVGVGNPTITSALSYTVLWNVSAAARSAHDTLTISGFTFDNSSTASDYGIVVLESLATDYVFVVIHSNTLKNATRGIFLRGRFYGVISTNTFENTYIPLAISGKDQNSWANETQTLGMGSVVDGHAENIYFENNTIQMVGTNVASRMIAGGQGGRIVVRYNNFNMANGRTGEQVWEMHGLQNMVDATGLDKECGYAGHPICDPTIRSADHYSTMVSEFYGNRVYNWTSGNQWMAQRGGWMRFFYNTSDTSPAAPIQYAEYACDSAQYWGLTLGPYTMHVDNSYIWRNYNGASVVRMSKSLDYCADHAIGSPYTITNNRDYYTDSVEAFDGTTGIGCGTLASRPATCTTGVGYWVTNQSCSDMTGMVGANPATPISGTLYKCTAPNTWASDYVPYTYPHPLAGAAAPAAPTNVRIR